MLTNLIQTLLHHFQILKKAGLLKILTVKAICGFAEQQGYWLALGLHKENSLISFYIKFLLIKRLVEL